MTLTRRPWNVSHLLVGFAHPVLPVALYTAAGENHLARALIATAAGCAVALLIVSLCWRRRPLHRAALLVSAFICGFCGLFSMTALAFFSTAGLVLAATFEAPPIKKAGYLLVLAAACLANTTVLTGTLRWVLVGLAVALVVAHAFASPDDWRLQRPEREG